MKKALLILVAIVALSFLIGNADMISDFLVTIKTGAVVPLLAAGVLMLARHFVQAASYDAAFEAVGHKTGFWNNVVLIFSLVFINTFCLFSGATGVAFIIDDAHRKGADVGTATSGAILSQIGYFAAILVISVIGFVTMLVAGSMNTLFLIGGLLLAGTLVGLSSLFFVGYFKPDFLYKLFAAVERLGNKILGRFNKSLRAAWGSSTADSMINSARILAHNPLGAFISIAYAACSAMLNMACLVAIGYAFGFESLAPLIAAFALASISVILSPTPQGVGVVEAAIAMILTANGCSLPTATAIALVYRGIMFWVPFCIGAVLLSQSGFFKDKKTPTEWQRSKDIGWVAGTLVGIVGLVNIGISQLPDFFAPYATLTQWVDLGGMFIGPTLVAGGVILLLVAVGLVLRYRTVWAIAMAALTFIAGGEFLFANTIKVAIPILLLTVWLFIKRDAFDRPLSWPPVKKDKEALPADDALEPNPGKKRSVRAARTRGGAGLLRESTHPHPTRRSVKDRERPAENELHENRQ
ncbi:MAG: lysylphosphatidylglycerol synthase transmembrane domain-containing protein [Raoultibacter sp.]